MGNNNTHIPTNGAIRWWGCVCYDNMLIDIIPLIPGKTKNNVELYKKGLVTPAGLKPATLRTGI